MILAGTTPDNNAETVLISALVQAPAGKITPLSDQLTEQDFTPAGWVVFSEITHQAQQVAGDTILNLAVVNAALSAQGALQAHDDGVRALLAEIVTTPADPVFIPQLATALQQQAYRRALVAYQDTVTEIDAQTIGITDADQLLNAALKRLRAARQRLETATPNQTTGGHLAAA